MAARRSSWRWVATTREALPTLHPGYFALVMATGILSTGLHIHGLAWLSEGLLWLAATCYLLLLVLFGWRLVAFGDNVRQDLTDPRTGFGFFAFVAGTEVLGTRLALDGHHRAAFALLAIGLLAWIVLGYLVPWAMVLAQPRRSLIADANGTWFIWIVASQSVAVLTATLTPTTATARPGLTLLTVAAWSIGVALYVAVAIAITIRLLLYPLRPEDLAPPYWIAMGATAITVLAASRIAQLPATPVISQTRHLVAGAAVMFWAFGTWLLPALVAAGWWRHVAHRVPLRYEETVWSIVFPLGMYGVASHHLGDAENLPVVRVIGEYEIWIALVAWVIAFAAMLARLGSIIRRREPRP